MFAATRATAAEHLSVDHIAGVAGNVTGDAVAADGDDEAAVADDAVADDAADDAVCASVDSSLEQLCALDGGECYSGEVRAAARRASPVAGAGDRRPPDALGTGGGRSRGSSAAARLSRRGQTCRAGAEPPTAGRP